MRHVLPVLATAWPGCGTSPDPYEVIASASLTPGTEHITGALDVLGTGDAGGGLVDHMVTASRLHLPDDRPRRIRLYDTWGDDGFVIPASCDTPHAEVAPVWNLGQIRRVGDETHFFATDVFVGDRLVTLDVNTRFVTLTLEPGSLISLVDLIAVVEDFVPGEAAGLMPGAKGATPRDWLACGAFTLAE